VNSLTKRLLIGAVVVFAVVPLAKFLLVKSDGAGEAAVAQAPGRDLFAEINKVQTIVSREPSEGFTDSSLNQEALSRIEERTLALFREKMQKELGSKGKNLDPERLTADSVYVEKEGRKLAVTKLRADGVAIGVQIAGLVDDEFVRLACISSEPVEPEIITGPCAEETARTFGVSLGGNNNG
jgi:hypothetical protein